MHINKIGLGTVQFGLNYGIANTQGQTTPEEVAKILAHARLRGIDNVDSASAYGNAEEVLGKIGLFGFKVISKFISPNNDSDLRNQLESSFKNLRVENLYAYLAHRPQEVFESSWQWKVLQDLKLEGKVQKIGFSLNRVVELENLLSKNYLPDLIQVPYNYFDHRFERLMIQLKENGCEIHTRSAFLQGLFFKQPDSLPNHFKQVIGIIEGLQKSHFKLSGSLLKYVVDKPFIDKVIIGVENVEQLKVNLDDLENGTELENLSSPISEEVLMPSHWPKT